MLDKSTADLLTNLIALNRAAGKLHLRWGNLSAYYTSLRNDKRVGVTAGDHVNERYIERLTGSIYRTVPMGAFQSAVQDFNLVYDTSVDLISDAADSGSVCPLAKRMWEHAQEHGLKEIESLRSRNQQNAQPQDAESQSSVESADVTGLGASNLNIDYALQAVIKSANGLTYESLDEHFNQIGKSCESIARNAARLESRCMTELHRLASVETKGMATRTPTSLARDKSSASPSSQLESFR